jgi:ABC-type nitrate/sulfonate/bicarbonate transport system permease component
MDTRGTTQRGERASRWLAPALLLAALIGAWQIAASTGALADLLNLESFLVPSPAEVASSLWENRALLAENAWVTLREVLIGFALAVALGLVFALVLNLSDVARRATYPLLVSSQAIPILALAPIFVVLFGYGIVPKLAIIALVCFFPITVSTFDGLRSVDPEARKLMLTLDGSRRQIFQRLEAPTALPNAFSGAKVAAGFAPVAALFAEWAGSSSGLGHLILQDNGQLQTARLFASILILAAIGLSLFALIALVERLVVTWR